MDAETRLKSLSIELPPPPNPRGSYVPALVHNGVLYLSGQGPVLAGGGLACGLVGRDVNMEEAILHARLTGLQLLAAAQQTLGSLNRVERVLQVLGLVNAAPGFTQHPKVINGCSDLFIEVFGEAGRHTRAAFGAGSLPENITVEIMAQMAVKA